ncbi:hypothetical protein [Flavobacterium gawalongense]|uniref:Uncharacterized protein n=1 Tax=Flavobacterium gawalongense TaxID=2594432 RepID=A0A553BUF7_9FLAO|nr:hypothetical protein [Flavobacterium gawalongense]TRX11884.1 hypothetical protein FNW11_04740 [Flavobacterium gawalongense]TRX13064.1 hypothetical protein FNW10_03300 [Flavobacterium gawalongense]TRX30967.1 hypothetical protein FNW38_01950 [Flavobacterium gawalongense]
MRNLILFFFFTTISIAFGQNQKLLSSKINHVIIDADQFLGYDQFDYYYTIKNNVFSKIKDKESLEYKNITLGKITKIDLLNPLKIVLFYENFNTAILLDNQLNETQKINFSENPIPIVVNAIGIASQNQLWVYNSLNQQIGLYDYLKNDYKVISTSFPESIKYYQSNFNAFYWIDDKNNWFSCDIFGKITKKGKTPDFDSIEIINDNQFIFSKNSILTIEDIEKNQKFEIEILEKTFKKFGYKDQILSIFTSGGITNYKITIP